MAGRFVRGASVGVVVFVFAACEGAETTPGDGDAAGIDGGAGDGEATADADAGAGGEPDAVPEAEPEPECALGTPCDDGDKCTIDDACDEKGDCAGAPKDCGDGLDCTADTCAAGTCSHTLQPGFCNYLGACVSAGESPAAAPCRFCIAEEGEEPGFGTHPNGMACEDQDLCTVGGTCSLGDCKPESLLDCGEGNECVEASCDPAAGCLETAVEGLCDDGDACTLDDACDAGNCTGSGTLDCDDGDACTTDSCHPNAGCLHVASGACDDGEACTADACAPADGACSHEAIVGPCEDGDLCTAGEACLDSVCAGAAPIDCDDGEPCTADSCDPAKGCLHEFLSGSCDDGYGCTPESACAAGQCVGAKVGCKVCPSPKTTLAAKVTVLSISEDGKAGGGLDVDGDPTTCAPAGECSSGIDNALAILAPFLNDAFAASLENGTVKFVVDLSKAAPGDAEFPFHVYDTEISAISAVKGCDFQTEECIYEATQFSFDPGCTPFFGLENGHLDGDSLTAGGKGHVMVIAFQLGEEVFVPITLVHATLDATVQYAADGVTLDTLAGVIGGATPKKQLIETISALPESAFPADKDAIVSLLETLLEPDIDMDGNGTLDGVSVGLQFATIPADLQ